MLIILLIVIVLFLIISRQIMGGNISYDKIRLIDNYFPNNVMVLKSNPIIFKYVEDGIDYNIYVNDDDEFEYNLKHIKFKIRCNKKHLEELVKSGVIIEEVTIRGASNSKSSDDLHSHLRGNKINHTHLNFNVSYYRTDNLTI